MKNEFLYQQIKKQSKDFERAMNEDHRKTSGSFYTSIDFTLKLWKNILCNFSKEELLTKKILEPCVGTGNYIFSLLFLLQEFNYTQEEIQIILDNIYVCDINTSATTFYKCKLQHLVLKLYNIRLKENYFYNHIANALIFNPYNEKCEYISIKKAFPNINFKFDIIATNPPYKLIKNDFCNIKSTKLKEFTRFYFPNIGTKNINLFKFFVEDTIKNYANKNAYISLLIPLTILKDISNFELRNFIINSCIIKNIICINEYNKYIDASQAMCNLFLFKKITYNNYFFNIYDNDKLYAKYSMQEIFDNDYKEILLINKNFKLEFDKLNSFPKIRDINFINGYRGELDLSIYKNSYSNKKTSYPLIRGRQIKDCSIELSNEYVIDEFVTQSNKKEYILKERIAFQQICNMNKKKRLNFVLCKSNLVLANSCNFLILDKNNKNVDKYFILAILNSLLINDFYKIYSSNNHINIYEINNLPIPIDYENKTNLSRLYKEYLTTNDKNMVQIIEREVRKAFGL